MIEITIALIGGFISIITLLVKAKIENKKQNNDLKNLIRDIKENDEKQNKDIDLISNSLKIIKDDVKKQNFDINKFFSNQQLINKILQKNLELHFNLSSKIVDNFANDEKDINGIELAKQRIIDFETIVKDYNKFSKENK